MKQENRTIKLFVMMFMLATITFLELTMVSGAQIFKQNTPTDLKIQCIINGTFCSGSATCNVSVTNPDGSLLINNQGMTNQGSFHNYTLPDTATLGDYLCSATCCDGSYCGTGTDCDYMITTTGSDKTLYLPLFLLLGAFIIFGFASYLKNEYVGLFSGFLFIIAGVYMMIFGLGNFADMYTRAISFISLGIGLSVCAISMVEMFYTPLGITGGGEDD
jgi:hypothetical protein